ncbi:Nif3-like dinuclear metal center hexameric protein [Mesobacillus subterraneus]|jgi:dinuclear metal center YbgI/SA1388 family protein|uniref:Nif3-like dinuclear metal center hexameric protein n=1 Tax=Mesobacillus subterraneus TaxID=285983 RepID=UPI00203C68F7|nr:Nif3-like dinuclear metal center hexameric protein [Mesobacillus subterraneus]MCM3666549.1 Nif3-like dinuclear metal center hexameric protein [Mesobacillus subterraneus]MCM3685917.1 Nif3-like dinuclear metal center hexameric protein [Mesobacillus subterraneus]
MDVTYIVGRINGLFNIINEEIYSKESGLTYHADKKVKKLGYSVNLTLDTIEEARIQGVDMMVTHHDAWGELYELKEACIEKLAEYGISHYYNHLPLDDCNFGTNDSLLTKLNLEIVKRTHEWEGLYFGRVAESDEEIEFKELVNRMVNLLEEPVKFWRFNDKKVKRVGLVCGNGAPTDCLKEAVENECDVYITGECNLSTIQYAQFKRINLIIGSHTFTELFGIESLALKLNENIKELEVVRLNEGHY